MKPAWTIIAVLACLLAAPADGHSFQVLFPDPATPFGAPASQPEGPGGPVPGAELQRLLGRHALLQDPGGWKGADTASGPGGSYEIRFVCPQKTTEQPDQQVLVDRATCPMMVLDLFDIMGQPVLVVDPKNPDLQSFHALHGGRGIHLPPPLGDGQPPTTRSRDNGLHQPHTTFQSNDGGSSWWDNRYYAPDRLALPNRTVFGEDNAAVLDSQGRLNLASLYSIQDEGKPGVHYAVGMWKMGRMERKANYFENLKIAYADDLDVVDHLHEVYDAKTDRVIVLWREVHNETVNATRAAYAGLPSWIEAYRSKAGEGAQWERLPAVQRFGPCRSITNALALNGQVYVGCLPDSGYAATGASFVHWQLYAIDAASWTTRRLAEVPLEHENGLLVDRGGGHMIFVSSGVTNTGDPTLRVSYGALGMNWQDPEDYSAQFTNRLESGNQLRVVEARVTAAGYTKETGYLHLLYLERYEAHPSRPETQLHHTFWKTYGVVRPITGFQGRYDLKFGEATTRIAPSFLFQGGLSEEIYNDLHDSIVVWHDPKVGREHVFVAFGDYGYVRYAEALQENAIPPIPLPPIEFPALPVLAQATNTATTGAVVGAMTALMLLRLLASKKKAAVKAPSL